MPKFTVEIRKCFIDSSEHKIDRLKIYEMDLEDFWDLKLNSLTPFIVRSSQHVITMNLLYYYRHKFIMLSSSTVQLLHDGSGRIRYRDPLLSFNKSLRKLNQVV